MKTPMIPAAQAPKLTFVAVVDSRIWKLAREDGQPLPRHMRATVTYRRNGPDDPGYYDTVVQARNAGGRRYATFTEDWRAFDQVRRWGRRVIRERLAEEQLAGFGALRSASGLLGGR